MAAVLAVPPLAPRPSRHAISPWKSSIHFMEGREHRPALKQLQQSSQPPKPRRERPCDGCRRRKSKCVLQDSRRCILCEFHDQECTFVENAQPRKRKLDDVSAKENAPKRSPPSTRSFASCSLAQQQKQTTVVTATSALIAPVNSKSFAIDESLSLQRHRHCRWLGHTTALDAALIGLGSFDKNYETASELGTLRQVASDEYFNTHADADVAVPDDETRALSDIEAMVGRHGPALIEIYFRRVHPSFPIIQKRIFLDRMNHGDRQFNPPLLASMYLLAIQWWESDVDLSQHTKPDIAKLEYIALTSLTIAMQRPKMSVVQAGLLLLQRPKSSTWTLTVQLVALGQDIGLHIDCSDWSIPLWERRLRKRLAWALYMQDKWSALMHGRPSHINVTDWAVPLPSISDFEENLSPVPAPAAETHSDEEAETRQGIAIFMRMIGLTSIMAEVCATFYSQTAVADFARAGRFATQLVLNRAKPVQIKLKDWFSRLPPECKMESVSPAHTSNSTSAASPCQLSGVGYLHLGYFATEISIHRRIVQSLDSATSDQYMLYICRSAAKTRLISAMDFVNRLRLDHLDAFWYFASASNFALIGTFGALLMATSPAREEAAFYEARLREFRWTLGCSARKASWIDAAVQLLHANIELLRALPIKREAVIHQQRSTNDEVAAAGIRKWSQAEGSHNASFSDEGDIEVVELDV